MRATLTDVESITQSRRVLRESDRSPHVALPVLLTVDETADLLRTTRRAIYAMVERHQLPGVIRIRRNQDLTTTQRYMHLSPAAIEGAIRLLERPNPRLGRGDMLETANVESAISNP